MGRGTKNEIMEGRVLLEKVEGLIRDASRGDEEREFYFNRFLFQRFKGKEDKQKKRIKEQLFVHSPKCSGCKKNFQAKDLDVHRIDDMRGYKGNNCVLVCKECHEKRHKGLSLAKPVKA